MDPRLIEYILSNILINLPMKGGEKNEKYLRAR